MFDGFEIIFGGEGEERDEGVVFSIADDIISDFGDAIGLVFEYDFEVSLLNIWGVLLVSDVLSDSIAHNFGRVAVGERLGHLYLGV